MIATCKGSVKKSKFKGEVDRANSISVSNPRIEQSQFHGQMAVCLSSL